ncbi:MAG: SDR family NAD(P)-dependent oxidoreductase [Candidatus Gottesmanbacteria bacterium]|nr:SDR family NAD(P)-dependent oxidoreductase [Candidatus Gottesmanbacteria bacterium]
MFDLTGKIALVTGASSGIGRASALALARQGATVVVAARRVEKLQTLAKEIVAMGRESLPVAMDVTKKDTISSAVNKTVEMYGKIDILLNNAGVAEFTPFLDLTEEQWDKTLDTNLKGCFLVAQLTAREMAKHKWGRIVNIASIASGGVGVGFPSVAHYCASKGGIVAMTEAMAIELAPMGILVNCIGPGVIETEMTEGLLKDPKQAEALLARAPLKRAGKAEEIAAAVVYFASNESSYTTGSILYVDGGWLAN